MNYNEMINKVNKNIKEGKNLHGYKLDIAIEMALTEMEKNKNK